MTPTHHLAVIGRDYPNAWKLADLLRTDRGKGIPDWADWCFVPMGGWYAIVSEQHSVDMLTLSHLVDVQRLAALGAWRPTQGVYRFDAELYDALLTTPLAGDMPHDVLYRLPAWCVYVETPLFENCGEDMHGFFAYLEEDANSGAHELRLMLDLASGLLKPLIVHLGDWSLAEGVARMRAVTDFNAATIGAQVPGMPSEELDTLQKCLSLLLYLCSETPDGRGPKGEVYGKQFPQPKKVKSGWRLFPPDAPTVWVMGEKIGAEISAARAAREAGHGDDHASPRPHVRRAHWHGFWSGPRDGDRRFDLKWLPPIAVALKDEE